jgi:hypothetical protein
MAMAASMMAGIPYKSPYLVKKLIYLEQALYGVFWDNIAVERDTCTMSKTVIFGGFQPP